MSTKSATALTVVVATFLLPIQPLLAFERHALVVGCSQYEHYPNRTLLGAANDAAAFRGLLRDKCGFPAANIESLVGTPADETKRPTYRNICLGFERLVQRSNAGDQVVIYMVGHGCRKRLALPDATEPDGYDEAFVPADQTMDGDVIVDNQVGDWLQQLRGKGAHVWIIFDSCFSGTMTRGGADFSGEAPLSLSPPLKRTPLSSVGRYDGLDVPHTSSDVGSLVALYAAQEFEEAVEVIRPPTADEKLPTSRHCLLSYHLNQALTAASERMTYRDLSRNLVSRYRGDGRTYPTPFFEGGSDSDLDREVLGFNKWPQQKPLILERDQGKLLLSAGQLAGIVPETIVAVFQVSDKENVRPLGHLRIAESTPTAAVVEPVEFGGLPAPSANELPDNALCRVVSQDLGEMQIKLKIPLLADSHSDSYEKQLVEAVQRLATKEAVFRLVEKSEPADWSLLVTSSPLLTKRLGMESKSGPLVVLAPGSIAELVQNDQIETDATETAIRFRQQPYAMYSATSMRSPAQLADQLAEELRKVYAWQNVWRIAGLYSQGSPLVERQYLRLEVTGMRSQTASSTEQKLASNQLRPGESIDLHIVNSSYDSHSYTVLFLSGRFGVLHVATGSIRGRDHRKLDETAVDHAIASAKIGELSIGTNGFVVIGQSQRNVTYQLNLLFLAQSPLGSPGTRASVDRSKLQSPFEKLISLASTQNQRYRTGAGPNHPQIASWSWVSVPTESPGLPPPISKP